MSIVARRGFLVMSLLAVLSGAVEAADILRVGAAAVNIRADDAMIIGGSIEPHFAQGQEGELRAVAIVLESPRGGKLGIVACDVLMLTRDLLDPVTAELENTCGIPTAALLINATHTHHAPSTVTVHGYERDEEFCRRVQHAAVEAVTEANARLAPATFAYRRGEEQTVGENSRVLLADGTISWIGPNDDAVRTTGPFDPALPVLAFRDGAGRPVAVWFNHSTHTIGTLQPRVRSPSFYGLAAQALEQELGGVVGFLEGASGSTHNRKLPPAEALRRIQAAVADAYKQSTPRAVEHLAAIKRPFTFRVRTFDETLEDDAVTSYTRRRAPQRADAIIDVFRRQRAVLRSQQGQERETWVQALAIGDVAIVGVPAEFFTGLGLEIKRRSPFPETIVAELANDWIGYLPDREAHRLGGYQTWTGLHSYAEPGTGERVVDAVVELLDELRHTAPTTSPPAKSPAKRR